MARKFEPHTEIALGKSQFNPEVHKTFYRYNYEKAFRGIAEGKVDERAFYRQSILTDLWFMLYFVIEIPDNKKPNHPFVVERCNDIQYGPGDSTLDVWFRGGYKSSIITIAETIQYQLKYPESATGIFSHKASIAKSNFLFEIKQIFENSKLLKACFPDVVWENPFKDAPIWSLDGGLVLKRKSNRREASVSAHGLVEGMPTGLHFERMIYDDITTADLSDSPDVMEKIKEKFDVSRNLRTHTGLDCHRIVGTFYHFNDPLTYIRDKKEAGSDRPRYMFRKIPATEDGSPNGKSVFLPEESLNDLRGDKSFFSQQLCDPSPIEVSSLKSDLIVEYDKLPEGCYKFMIIDQAGDLEANLKSGDCWAICAFAVKPFIDDVGASDIYIEDIVAEPLAETEAINIATNMYIRQGVVHVLGVEKVGISSTHNQIRSALKARGRNLTIENDIKKKRVNVIMLLRPSGRNKVKFIESAVAFPLFNSKIHISDKIQPKYRQKLEEEMDTFPYGKTDDILNTIAYVYDVILQYNFSAFMENLYVPEPEYFDNAVLY